SFWDKISNMIISIVTLIVIVSIFNAMFRKGTSLPGSDGGSDNMRVMKDLVWVAEPKPITNTEKTFDDVKGIDECKEEIQELVEFLKNPSKFTKLGGKLPKGVLLVGP